MSQLSTVDRPLSTSDDTTPAPLSEPRFAAALSRFTRRYRWPLLAGWLVVLVVAGISASTIQDVLSGGGWFVPGSQSAQAADHLARSGMVGRGRTTVTLVVHDQRHTVTDPAFRDRARRVVDAVTADHKLRVASTYGWSGTGAGTDDQFTGRDRRTVVTTVVLRLDDGAARREVPRAQRRLTNQFDGQGLVVSLVGQASMWGAVNEVSQQSLVTAELIVLPLILVILLLLYRSVAAILVSGTVGVVAIVVTLGVLTPVARHGELSLFVQNVVTMLGLGVGVDYSLFVVSRFMEELRRGRTVPDAVTETLRTSGHTVLFSGITVVLTMATLFLVDLNAIVSLALGAVVVVAASVLAATLLLPVLLHLVGHRIEWGRLPLRRKRVTTSGVASRQSLSYRVASAVMRHPVLSATLAAVVLLGLAVPVFDLRTFSPDGRILPHSSPVRQGYDLVRDAFGVGAASPVQVVVRFREPIADHPEPLVTLTDRLAALPHVARSRSLVDTMRQVAAADPRIASDPMAALRPEVFSHLPEAARTAAYRFMSQDQRLTVIELEPDAPASDDTTRELVTQVRRLVADLPDGVSAVVGGETAEGMDANQAIIDSLPAVIVIMLVGVFVVLLVTFRSLLMPVKAVAMNLLSLGASYGVLVVIFQDGFGTDVLGLHHTGYLTNFVPVLLLALLFSLSTDYEVFLLDRVRERYLRTGDNREAVASAMALTGPLISGAAILMVAVFGAFAISGMVPVEQLGLGLAIAIAIDATIVRMILVPATMRLLGRANWWLPRFPRRRHDRSTPATIP